MTQHPELTLTENRPFQPSVETHGGCKPLAVFIGLGLFVLYGLFRVFEGDHFIHGPYLSPLYSPVLFGTEEVAHSLEHSWFGPMPSWIPRFHYPSSPDYVGTTRISLYLLLLPRRVLQSILGRPTLLHSVRTP